MIVVDPSQELVVHDHLRRHSRVPARLLLLAL